MKIVLHPGPLGPGSLKPMAIALAALAPLPTPVTQGLTILGVVLLLTGFGIIGARQLGDYVTAFTVQSLAITAIATTVGIATDKWDLYLVAGLTLLVKVIAIPVLLRAVIQRLPEQRERTPLLNTPLALIVTLALILIAFFTAPSVVTPGTPLSQPPLAISLALILIGLLALSVRRHAIAQLAGLLTIENGLFSGALTIASGMPLLVEFGILFDILIAVVIMTLLVSLLHRTVTSADTLDLRRLRG
jgi:hydrogenase-4 component E